MSRVWTNGEALEPSQLDDVLILDLQINYGPHPPTSISHPPDVIHMMNAPRPSSFFCHSSAHVAFIMHFLYIVPPTVQLCSCLINPAFCDS